MGYRNEWETKEAEKNLLRTHTTAISAQMLYKLAQMKTFEPKKFFSIDRVFRNETLDAFFAPHREGFRTLVGRERIASTS